MGESGGYDHGKASWPRRLKTIPRGARGPKKRALKPNGTLYPKLRDRGSRPKLTHTKDMAKAMAHTYRIRMTHLSTRAAASGSCRFLHQEPVARKASPPSHRCARCLLAPARSAVSGSETGQQPRRLGCPPGAGMPAATDRMAGPLRRWPQRRTNARLCPGRPAQSVSVPQPKQAAPHRQWPMPSIGRASQRPGLRPGSGHDPACWRTPPWLALLDSPVGLEASIPR
jgi:hypothetical protein